MQMEGALGEKDSPWEAVIASEQTGVSRPESWYNSSAGGWVLCGCDGI